MNIIHVYVYTYVYTYVYICVYIHTYIYIWKENQVKKLNKTSQKEEIQGSNEHLKNYPTNHQANAN